MGALHFSKLYAVTAIAGITGVIAGGFTASSVFTAMCPTDPECFGPSFLWTGLGFISVESCAMSLAVHIANKGQGNLRLTFLPTVLLAMPMPLLLPAFTVVLVLPLFLFQAWVCVKIQLATAGRKRARRRA